MQIPLKAIIIEDFVTKGRSILYLNKKNNRIFLQKYIKNLSLLTKTCIFNQINVN